MADPSLAYHWGEFEEIKGGSSTSTARPKSAAAMSSTSKARGGGGGSWEDLRKEVHLYLLPYEKTWGPIQ